MTDEILNDLRNIKSYISSNGEGKELHYEFREFLKKCMNVQLADISFIYGHLNDLHESIKIFFPIKDNKNWSLYENIYTQI